MHLHIFLYSRGRFITMLQSKHIHSVNLVKLKHHSRKLCFLTNILNKYKFELLSSLIITLHIMGNENKVNQVT